MSTIYQVAIDWNDFFSGPLHAVSASYITMCIAIQDCSCWGSMNPPTPIPPRFPIFHFPFPIPTISSEAILFSHSHFGFAHINFSIWNCILHTLYDYCSLLTFDCQHQHIISAESWVYWTWRQEKIRMMTMMMFTTLMDTFSCQNMSWPSSGNFM